jgi:hypothetical protein
MINYSLLKAPVALFGILIAVLNGVGAYFSLYEKIWWYDIPMHVMGGTWTAFLVLIFVFRKKRKIIMLPSVRNLSIVALSGVLIIGGILWEGYEVIVSRLISHDTFDVVDTLADIVNDSIGALIAVYVFSFLPRKT